VDVYSLLSDFPDGVERPALATPTARPDSPSDPAPERPAQ
jgi:hypothetical protein